MLRYNEKNTDLAISATNYIHEEQKGSNWSESESRKACIHGSKHYDIFQYKERQRNAKNHNRLVTNEARNPYEIQWMGVKAKNQAIAGGTKGGHKNTAMDNLLGGSVNPES